MLIRLLFYVVCLGFDPENIFFCFCFSAEDKVAFAKFIFDDCLFYARLLLELKRDMLGCLVGSVPDCSFRRSLLLPKFKSEVFECDRAVGDFDWAKLDTMFASL